jgi:hypothetical protein
MGHSCVRARAIAASLLLLLLLQRRCADPALPGCAAWCTLGATGRYWGVRATQARVPGPRAGSHTLGRAPLLVRADWQL